jgi:hypothetical protein
MTNALTTGRRKPLLPLTALLVASLVALATWMTIGAFSNDASQTRVVSSLSNGYYSLDHLATNADVVVTGTMTSVVNRQKENGIVPTIIYEFHVDEALKGSVEESILLAWIDSQGPTLVSTSPAPLKENEEVLLFLRAVPQSSPSSLEFDRDFIHVALGVETGVFDVESDGSVRQRGAFSGRIERLEDGSYTETRVTQDTYSMQEIRDSLRAPTVE